MTPTENGWLRLIEANPAHSRAYIERFRNLAADGFDLGGEARLIDAMADRGAHILDAGCGPGRTAAALHAAGHRVVGVDLDPILIEAARHDHPGPEWRVADLATLDLPGRRFDLIVSAGNVMAFLAPATRRPILGRLKAHLNPTGRIVTGFGAGRGYPFDDYLDDVAAAGLEAQLTLSTWDLRPFTPTSDFLVAVLAHRTPPAR